MKTVSHDAVKNAGPFLVNVKVSFGPAFSDKKLTHREFVQKLREEAKRHPKSFLSTMMNHFAEHIEAAASNGNLSLDHEADTNPNTTYYGHGSCTGCPGDDGSGYPCCLCVYNGQNVGCESC
jgi:hypothetical protein